MAHTAFGGGELFEICTLSKLEDLFNKYQEHWKNLNANQFEEYVIEHTVQMILAAQDTKIWSRFFYQQDLYFSILKKHNLTKYLDNPEILQTEILYAHIPDDLLIEL